jgi:hypothetical protein
MLNEPFVEPGTGEFARGRLLGQQEERERLWDLLHNSLNPHLIVAAFAAQNAKERLESKGLAEAADLSKVTNILDTVIEQTVRPVLAFCRLCLDFYFFSLLPVGSQMPSGCLVEGKACKVVDS